MTTYSLSGFSITQNFGMTTFSGNEALDLVIADPNNTGNSGTPSTLASLLAPAPLAEVRLNGLPLEETEINGTLGGAIGEVIGDLLNSGGTIGGQSIVAQRYTWGGQETDIFKIRFEAMDIVTEHFFVLGGAPLPQFTSAQDYDAFLQQVTNVKPINGPLTSAPVIDWGAAPGVEVSEDDLFSGTEGADEFSSGLGNDTLKGGSGNDHLNGNVGDDFLYGGSGADTLQGGGGSDRVSGNSGDDEVRGGSGDDEVRGGNDKDSVYGGNGNDILFGGNGYDSVFGGDGSDTLYGGTGNDSLYGGDGRDTLNGGTGDDVLSGGNGADIFVFSGNFGKDTITDWDKNGHKDQIDLRGVSAIENFDDLINHHVTQSVAVPQGGSGLPEVVTTNIIDHQGNVISLTNVAISALDDSDFIF